MAPWLVRLAGPGASQIFRWGTPCAAAARHTEIPPPRRSRASAHASLSVAAAAASSGCVPTDPSLSCGNAALWARPHRSHAWASLMCGCCAELLSQCGRRPSGEQRGQGCICQVDALISAVSLLAWRTSRRAVVPATISAAHERRHFRHHSACPGCKRGVTGGVCRSAIANAPSAAWHSRLAASQAGTAVTKAAAGGWHDEWRIV